MKIKNYINLLLLLIFGVSALATDYKNVKSSSFIGGNPFAKSSVQSRTMYVPYKYANNRNKSIQGLYRGSSHERALDNQIRNYRSSARENERVFGAPYREQKNIRNMLQSGRFRIVKGQDGKNYLVENK